MLKKFLFILSTSFTMTTFALSTSEVLQKTQCQSEWKVLLPQSSTWLADTSGPLQKAYKVFDETKNAWNVVSIQKNGALQLQAEHAGTIQIQRMNSSCKVQVQELQADRFSAQQIPNAVVHQKKFKVFDDQSLEKLKSAQKLTVVYVWSPSMVYSSQYHNDFQKMAQKMGYDFLSVVDFRVSAPEIEGMNRQFSSAALPFVFKSNDLFLRGALLHFPTSFLVGQGRIWGQGIVGIVDENMFQKVFRTPAGKAL